MLGYSEGDGSFLFLMIFKVLKEGRDCFIFLCIRLFMLNDIGYL